MGHVSYAQDLQLRMLKLPTGYFISSMLSAREAQWRLSLANSRAEPVCGFHLHWARFRKPSSWVLSFNWGIGAGYIGGWSAFIGRRCRGGRVWPHKSAHPMAKPEAFRFGITRNANKKPYPNW